MKIKRHKKFLKHMGFFEKNFRFRSPYLILIDGTFVQAVLCNKVNMKEQLPKYLNGHVKLLTTVCTQRETECLGPELYGALQILKQTQIQKCTHMEKPVSAAVCLKSVVENNIGTYLVATQDGNLRYELRNIPGVPILYLYGTAPTLEKPSESSVKFADKNNLKKMEVLEYQKEILDHFKEEDLATATEIRKGTKKRKRAGPNPLSCKKSKKVRLTLITQKKPTQEKKRKRVRVRVPQHVKDNREIVLRE